YNGCQINRSKYLVPFEFGFYYDPAPAKGRPDDYWGITFASGIEKKDLFSIDLSYEYRFGNNIGTSILKELKFKQDVNEHQLNLSFIIFL
ncbi:hypothetical protein MHK_010448, partial [Candidatus Magnetomorum sp. HK-1]